MILALLFLCAAPAAWAQTPELDVTRAEQGHVDAQFQLAARYANGDGMPRDDGLALSWYRKAAEQGHARAQLQVGVIHENGIGMEADGVQAVRWYRKAAEQRVFRAQSNLGFMYATGRGVPVDKQQAYFWWFIASAGGDETSLKNAEGAARGLSTMQRSVAEADARIWMQKYK
ncbi:MAG: tetratricopeptide repeat protein [Pseudomonadota bacterium]